MGIPELFRNASVDIYVVVLDTEESVEVVVTLSSLPLMLLLSLPLLLLLLRVSVDFAIIAFAVAADVVCASHLRVAQRSVNSIGATECRNICFCGFAFLMTQWLKWLAVAIITFCASHKDHPVHSELSEL